MLSCSSLRLPESLSVIQTIKDFQSIHFYAGSACDYARYELKLKIGAATMAAAILIPFSSNTAFRRSLGALKFFRAPDPLYSISMTKTGRQGLQDRPIT